jgi:MFS family permease
MEPSKLKQVSDFEMQKSNQESFMFNPSLKDSVTLLKRSEKSLFLTFLINFATSIQYYILVTLIPLYFSTEHSYSDLGSGLVFGGFGVTIGVISLMLSSKMDKISFDLGLLISFLFGITGFLLLLVNNEHLSLLSVFFFQSLSCSIAWPFAEYGIKQFSDPIILNLTNSCFFISNYSAGILAGLFIDSLWAHLEDKKILFVYIAAWNYFFGYCFDFIEILQKVEMFF